MRYPTRAAHFHSNIYAYELNYTLYIEFSEIDVSV